MFTLELSEKELSSLISFIENRIFPCEDCSPDIDCGAYSRGLCISKNMADILAKLRKLDDV